MLQRFRAKPAIRSESGDEDWPFGDSRHPAVDAGQAWRLARLFSETFRGALAAYGVDTAFLQDNHVFSARKDVLRGLYFQFSPHPQGKVVRCARGTILDVGVDIRPSG